MLTTSRRAFLGLLLGTVGSSSLLAACQPTPQVPTPAAPKPAAQPTPAPQPTAAQKAPAAAGPASGPIKIGLISAFSGPFAAFGPTQKDAMEIAFVEVNNTLGGRQVQLIVEDEGTEVQQALQKVRKLVEQDQVDVLVGIIQTPFAYGARDYIHENKVIFVCANAGGNALTRERKSPYIFRSSFSAWQNSFPLGEWTYKNVGKRVMVLATDFAFGHESADAFMDNFRKQGGTVLKEIYPRLGTTDFGPFLPDVQSTRPDFAYVFFAGADAVAFIKQWDEFGVGKDVPLTGTGDVVEEIVLPAQGRGGLGARTSLHWAWGLETPENAAYKDAFKKKTGREADQYGVQAYDAAKALILAVGQTQGDVADKDKLIKALEGVSFSSPRGPFRFDPATHQVIYNVYIREVRDFSGTLHNAVIDTFKDVQDPGA
jgi:branched-chain amino acid transport system substrate-binding protein